MLPHDDFKTIQQDPSKFSGGSFQAELKLNEEEVALLNITTLKALNNIKANIICRVYYFKSEVDFQFDNSNDLTVTTSMKLNQFDNNLKLIFSHNSTANNIDFMANVPLINWKNMHLTMLHEKNNKALDVQFKLNQKFFNLRADINMDDDIKDASMSIESNMYTWDSFVLMLTADLKSEPKVIKISGKSSNDLEHVNIDITIGALSGEMIVDVNVPFLSITTKYVKIKYAMKDRELKVYAEFNKDILDLSIILGEEEVIYSIQSPFPFIQDISGTIKYYVSQDYDNIEIKSHSMVSGKLLEINFDCKRQEVITAQFSISTTIEAINNLTVRITVGREDLDIFTEYNKSQIVLKLNFNPNQIHLFLSSTKEDNADRIIFNYAIKDGGDIDVVINMNYQIMENNGTVNIHVKNNAINIFASEHPHLGEGKLRIEWTENSIEIDLKNSNETLIELKLLKIISKQSKADMFLSLETLIDYLKKFQLRLEYDIDDIETNFVNFKYQYNKSLFDLRFTFQANLDKFDGTFNLYSSIVNWEKAVINMHYDLGDKTKVTFKISRNDRDDLIDINIGTDGYRLQVVKLITPFEGYENITILGMRRRDDFYEIQLKINTELYLRTYIRFQSREGHGVGDIRARVEFPGFSNKNIQWNMTYDISESVQMKTSFARSLNVYYLTVTEDKFRNILVVNLRSPYNDLEINGLFGTKEFSSFISHGKDRNKRSVGVALDKDDDTFNILLTTPFKSFSGFELKSKYHSDARVLSFKFNNYQESRFGVVLDYNITNFPRSGKLACELLVESLGIDYEGMVEYKVNKTNLDRIDGLFHLKKQKQLVVSGQLNRISGKSQVTLQTPIRGWRDVRLALESDWYNQISLALERDAIISKITIQKTNNSEFNVEIISPYSGYENIQTIVMIPKGKSKSIEIIKNGLMITKLQLEMDFDLASMTGIIKAKLKAINETFVMVSVNLMPVLSTLEIRTSYPKLKAGQLELHRSIVNERQNNNIKLSINDYFVYYNSSTLWTQNFIHSISSMENNIPILSFNKSETKTNITFSKAFDAPFTLSFVSIADGNKTFDVFSSIIVNFKTTGIELLYRGEFPLHSGKVKAKLVFKPNYSTLLELKGIIEGVEFEFALKQVSGNAEAKFKSNLEHFEAIEGKATWVGNRGKNKEFGFDASMDYNNTKLVGLSLWFTTRPISDISVSLVVQDYLNESIDIKIQHENDGLYNIFTSYIGFNNIDIIFKIDTNNYAIKVDIENFSQQRKWLLELQGLMKSKDPIKTAFILNLETPFSEKFQSSLKIDFTNEEKKASCMFSYGSILASTEATVTWTESLQKIHVNVVCPTLGLEKLDIILLKESSEHIQCEIEFNKKTIRLEVINKIISNSFLVGIDLSLPLDGYEKIIFFGKGKADLLKGVGQNYGIFVIETTLGKYDLKYEMTASNLTINIRTPISFSRNIRINVNFGDPSNYNIDLDWDNNVFEFNHQLNQTLSNLKIDFKTSLDYFKELYVHFSVDDKSMTLKGYTHGSLIDMELDLDCSTENNSTSITFQYKQGNVLVDGHMKLTTKDNEKVINAFMNINLNKIVEIESIILQKLEETEFKLLFLLPIYHNSKTNLFVSFNQRQKRNTGSFEILFKDVKTVIECGSEPNLLFLKVWSPTSKLTLNLNCNNRNMLLIVDTTTKQITANVTSLNESQNFSFKAIMGNETITFNGIINFKNFNFYTNFNWNKAIHQKDWESHVKVKYENKRLEVSFKTPSFVFKNLLLIGQWEKIDDGFSVSFSADVNDVHYSFDSKFTSTANSITGYWKIIDQLEKEIAAFDVVISYKEFGSDICVSFNSMWNVNAELHLDYEIYENKFSCKFDLLSHKISKLSNLTISYQMTYNSLTDFHMTAEVNAPELLLSFDQEFRMYSLSNVTMKSYTYLPDVDHLLDIEFKFQYFSLNDYSVSTKFQTKSVNIGGGVSYKKIGSMMDLIVDIIANEFKQKYKIGGQFQYPDPTGEISFYFNDANWYSFFDLDKYALTINANLNIKSLIQSTRLSTIDENVPLVAEKIELNIKFIENFIEFNVKILGDGMTSLSFLKDKTFVNGKVNINYPKYLLHKYGKFNMKFGNSGEIDLVLYDGKEYMEININDDDDSKVRKRRAVFSSPEYGSITMEESSKFKKGVIIVNSKNTFHKIVYEVTKTDGYDLTMTIESPVMNGTALIILNINEEMNKIRGSINLNNKYFISSAFKFIANNVELFIDIDSKDFSVLPVGTLKATYLKLMNTYTFNVDMNFQTTHKFSFKFVNEDTYVLEVKFFSGFFDWSPISLKSSVFVSMLASRSNFELSYNKENIMLDFIHNYYNLKQFDSRLEYSISPLQIQRNQIELLFDFFEKMMYTLSIKNKGERFEIVGTLKEYTAMEMLLITPIEGYERVELIVKKNGRLSFYQFNIDITLISLFGVTMSNIDWKTSNGHIQLLSKINLPTGKTYFQNIRCSLSDGIVWRSLLPYFELTKFELLRVDTIQNNLIDHLLYINLDLFNLHYDGKIALSYTNGYEVNALVHTPHENFLSQEIKLGFSNSYSRKMLKVYVDCKYIKSGIGMDYRFVSINDFTVEAFIDYPLPNWSDLAIAATSQNLHFEKFFQLKGKYEDKEIIAKAQQSSQFFDILFGINKEYFVSAECINFNKISKFCKSNLITTSHSYDASVDLDFSHNDNGILLDLKRNSENILKAYKFLEIGSVIITTNEVYSGLMINFEYIMDSKKPHILSSYEGFSGIDVKELKFLKVDLSDLAILYRVSDESFNAIFQQHFTTEKTILNVWLQNSAVLDTLSFILYDESKSPFAELSLTSHHAFSSIDTEDNSITLISPYTSVKLGKKTFNDKLESGWKIFMINNPEKKNKSGLILGFMHDLTQDKQHKKTLTIQHVGNESKFNGGEIIMTQTSNEINVGLHVFGKTKSNSLEIKVIQLILLFR